MDSVGFARKGTGLWRDLRPAAVIAAIQIGATSWIGHQHTHRLAGCWWGTCSTPRHLDVVAYVLLAAGPLAILLRRRYPRHVFVFVFAVTVLYIALGYPEGPIYLSLFVAFVRAVLAGERWLTRSSVVVGWALILWLRPALGTGPAPSALTALAVAAWLLALLVITEAVRGRRERFAEWQRRREQEARRRADEERLRIARELHDVLAHSISLINVQSGVALHLLDEQPEQARSALAAINEASAEALREVRSVLGVLRGAGETAPRAPTAGLARLDELLDKTRAAGIEVSLEIEGQRRSLPTSVDLAAYRIVQESLTNVVRHAAARRAAVRIAYGGRALTMEIEDDGRGPAQGSGDGKPGISLAALSGAFDQERGGDARADDGASGGGSGIAGMRERAVALGGSFEAGPRPDAGFRVWARLPLENGRENAPLEGRG